MMKKFISFLKYNKTMHKMYKASVAAMILGASIYLGLILHDRSRGSIDKYSPLSMPMLTFIVILFVVASPCLWNVSRTETFEDRRKTRIGALIGSIPVGIYLTVILYPLIGIEYKGFLNLIVAFALGSIYTVSIAALFRRPMEYVNAI